MTGAGSTRGVGQDVLLELGAEVFAPPRVVREVAVTLCCVCITVLAPLGVVSAGCAFLWGADLYDGYRCWFRLAGLTVVVVLAWVALRSAKCSLAGGDGAPRLIAMVSICGGDLPAPLWSDHLLGQLAQEKSPVPS